LRAAKLALLDSPNSSVLASLKVSLDALERENAAHARHLQHSFLHLALQNADAVHRELVEVYRQNCGGQWHTGPDDGYYFEHLAYHLRQAGQTAELYTLLTGSPAWMDAKYIACGDDSSYVADLDLALQDFVDPVTDPDRLLILAKLHTARQVADARVSVYDDTDLSTLVWLGYEVSALRQARLRAEANEQFDGLIAIYEALKAKGRTDFTLLYEAEAAARFIQEARHRVPALIALAAALARAGHSRAGSVFDEAGVAARALQDDVRRAWALRALAAALAEAARFDEAMAVTRAVQDAAARALALSALAAALAQASEARAGSVFDEAGVAARALQNDWERALALRALAVALARAGRFDEAAAHMIQDDWEHARALRELAVALARAGRFDQAEAVARAIQSDASRALALRDLAAALAQAGDERASRMFDEVEAVTGAIQTIFALGALTPARAQAGLFAQAFSALGERQADTFLEAIARWSPAFEQVKPGLSVAILREVTRIIGWVRPDWRKIHGLLWVPGWVVPEAREVPEAQEAHTGKLPERGIAIYVDGWEEPLIAVARDPLTLGRHTEMPSPDLIDLAPYDAYQMGVSRRHAVLTYKDNRLYISDVGSTNGTYLNGQRLVVYESYALQSGDELRLGKLKISIYSRSGRYASHANRRVRARLGVCPDLWPLLPLFWSGCRLCKHALVRSPANDYGSVCHSESQPEHQREGHKRHVT
jgi:hypothetical protein